MSTLHTHMSDCMYTGDEHAAHVHACVRDCVSATVAHVSLCACSVRVLCDVTASNTRDSYTDGESCTLHYTLYTRHVAPARCTHARIHDCVYMGVRLREHVHACVRDCVSATVAHVSLCACSVRVLCDVTASNTRDSCTDGEHCAPGTPALTVRDARCTLHTAHCTLRRMACMLETVSEHDARTLE